MSRYAVVLIEVPARVCDEVVSKLKADFATDHLIVADRSPQRPERYALYDQAGIERALKICATAVFGKTSRPYSFCRRPTQKCVLRAQKKTHADCGLSESQTCGIERPDYLLVLYQAAKDDSPILRELGFSAFARRLPLSCYGHAQQTFSEAKTAISEAKDKLTELNQWIKHKPRTPLLLPIKNFQPGSVLDMLKRSTRTRDLSVVTQRFNQSYWEAARQGFLNSSSLLFRPTPAAIAHGGRSAEPSEKKALRTEYRLGCCYDPGFHYDVTHTTSPTLANYIFMCSRNGEVACSRSDEYVNVYPDDFISTRN
jgi:hypothetical protein